MFIPKKLLVFFVITLILSASMSYAVAETENGTTDSDGLQILSKQKEAMERELFILVGLLEHKDITQEEFTKGQDLYNKARTARDTWITHVQDSLQKKQDPTTSDKYEQSLQKAGETSEVFREYVHEKFLGESRGPVAERTRDILKELKRSAQRLWAIATGSSSETVNTALEKQKLSAAAQIAAQN